VKRARLMLAKLGGAGVAALSLLGLPAAAHAQAGKLPVHVTGGADCGLWLAAEAHIHKGPRVVLGGRPGREDLGQLLSARPLVASKAIAPLSAAVEAKDEGGG
jgi:hypothetical protein